MISVGGMLSHNLNYKYTYTPLVFLSSWWLLYSRRFSLDKPQLPLYYKKYSMEFKIFSYTAKVAIVCSIYIPLLHCC